MRVRDRDRPLEDVERDLGGGVGRDADVDEVDERHGVARREQRAATRSGAARPSSTSASANETGAWAARPDLRDPTGGEQAGRVDEVGDELGDRIRREAGPRRAPSPEAPPCPPRHGSALVRAVRGVHPSNEVSAWRSRSLRTASALGTTESASAR